MPFRAIKQLTTYNYKNLINSDNNPGSDQTTCSIQFNALNIFIGPNGSGKSNSIQALKFLRGCFADFSDGLRGRTRFDDAIFELGGGRILNTTVRPPSEVKLVFDLSSNTPERRNSLELSMLVQDHTKPVIIKEESLKRYSLNQRKDEKPFYYYRSHFQRSGEGVVSIYNEGETSNKKPSSHLEQLRDVPANELTLQVISELLEKSSFAPEDTPIYEVRRDWIETIKNWHFYNANNMDLHQVRFAEPKMGPGDKYLSASGENIALVLHNLIRDNLDFDEALNHAAKAILPATRKVRAVPSGRLSLTIEWHFMDSNTPFYLNELSDGTVRMLLWATILLAPELPSLLVIDEPEMGLHVAWMPILADWIKQAAKRTQVIFCTHSPDLLDHFTDSLEATHVFQPTKATSNQSVIKQLRKEDLQSWLDQGWQLGDLYRVGDPSVGGWPW